MADLYENIGNKLISGEKVICPQCGKGIVSPYPSNIPPEKAHCFECSNSECDFIVHLDPAIVVD